MTVTCFWLYLDQGGGGEQGSVALAEEGRGSWMEGWLLPRCPSAPSQRSCVPSEMLLWDTVNCISKTPSTGGSLL